MIIECFTYYLGKLQVTSSTKDLREGERVSPESLYVLVHRTLLWIRWTYNIITAQCEAWNKVLDYLFMCNQWNTHLKQVEELNQITENIFSGQ